MSVDLLLSVFVYVAAQVVRGVAVACFQRILDAQPPKLRRLTKGCFLQRRPFAEETPVRRSSRIRTAASRDWRP